MKITIFGLPGTGTSTAGRLLASDLGYDFKYSGEMFRQTAESLGLSLNELEKLAATDPKYDRDLDEQVAAYGSSHDNFVFDSRLAWYFIPDSVKIKFVCDEAVRMARIAAREQKDIDQARLETGDRTEKIFERFSRYYGVDNCLADGNFDLIFDSTAPTPVEIVEHLRRELKI